MSHATLTPAELARELAAAPGRTVLDVRTPAEFAEVHATPARNLPLPDVSAASLAAIGHTDPAAPVYLLCQTDRRATAAADTLAAAGFKQPVVITGGTVAWAAAGLPVVRGGTKAVSIERQVRIVAGSIVLTGVILSQFVNPHFTWLSGFVGAGLVFAGVTDFCGMGILLSKAPWNRARPAP
jgi:rhodanese-related sulfurtransferase